MPDDVDKFRWEEAVGGGGGGPDGTFLRRMPPSSVLPALGNGTPFARNGGTGAAASVSEYDVGIGRLGDDADRFWNAASDPGGHLGGGKSGGGFGRVSV